MSADFIWMQKDLDRIEIKSYVLNKTKIRYEFDAHIEELNYIQTVLK